MVVCSLEDCPWPSEFRPISSDGCKECFLKFSERLLEAFISEWRHDRNVAFLSFGLSYIEGISTVDCEDVQFSWIKIIKKCKIFVHYGIRTSEIAVFATNHSAIWTAIVVVQLE